MRSFVLCSETGALAIAGACPRHGGDACLLTYEPVDRRTELRRAAARALGRLKYAPQTRPVREARGTLRAALESDGKAPDG